MIGYEPPVATGGKSACVVFNRLEDGRCGAWQNITKVGLVLVVVAVLVGDACAADDIGSVVLNRDIRFAFGDTQCKRKPVENNDEF